MLCNVIAVFRYTNKWVSWIDGECVEDDEWKKFRFVCLFECGGKVWWNSHVPVESCQLSINLANLRREVNRRAGGDVIGAQPDTGSWRLRLHTKTLNKSQEYTLKRLWAGARLHLAHKDVNCFDRNLFLNLSISSICLLSCALAPSVGHSSQIAEIIFITTRELFYCDLLCSDWPK